MSSHWLMFPGVRSSLVFSGFGLKSPASGFRILTVASRLLHLLLKTMGCLFGCLMSSASIQKLFCGIFSAFKCSFNEVVEEKVVSPSYSSTILGLPPLTFFFESGQNWHKYTSATEHLGLSSSGCSFRSLMFHEWPHSRPQSASHFVYLYTALEGRKMLCHP